MKIAGYIIEVIILGKTLIPKEVIENRIFLIRGQKVILDSDLAMLYGVKAIRLREQVKRNLRRFPKDFMFRLTKKETHTMVSHFAIPSWKHLGGHLPYVFTEYGVSMLSSVLNSEKAIQVNIAIMRAFGRLRRILATHKELANKLDQLENKVGKNSVDIQLIFQAIRELMNPPITPPKKIGFTKD